MTDPLRLDRFVLTSANLLIETNTDNDRHLRVSPQAERLPVIIDALRKVELEEKTRSSIQIAGLQELQIDDSHHGGLTIQNELGAEFGIWHPHSRHSVGEHIGAVSSVQPDDTEVLKLDKNRYAISMRFGEFYVCVAHAMYSDAKRRARQTGALIEYLSDKPLSALMADFNEEPRPWTTRNKLKSIGMRSASIRDGKGHPVTLPTPEYGKYRSWPRRIGFAALGGGLRYDDIYVSEAIEVYNTGTITADSDHRFVYASVGTPYGSYMDRDLT